jgi:hypothetical protein
MYSVSGSTDGGHRAGVSSPSPHSVETAQQRETVGHTHCECKSDVPVSTTTSNMSSVITQANFGGEAAVGLVSGPVCFAGRSPHAHVHDPDVISLGNRHQARFLHVLPMQMLPHSVNAPTGLRSSRPILIADVCPSTFHVLSDVVPGLMGCCETRRLIHVGANGRPSSVASGDSGNPLQLPRDALGGTSVQAALRRAEPSEVHKAHPAFFHTYQNGG